MTRSIFSVDEINSSAWQTLKEYINNRIQQLREINDKDTKPTETAMIRGRIAELKKLLDAVEPKEIKTTKPKRGRINEY